MVSCVIITSLYYGIRDDVRSAVTCREGATSVQNDRKRLDLSNYRRSFLSVSSYDRCAPLCPCGRILRYGFRLPRGSSASSNLSIVEERAKFKSKCRKTEWSRLTVAVSLRVLVIRIFIDFSQGETLSFEGFANIVRTDA